MQSDQLAMKSAKPIIHMRENLKIHRKVDMFALPTLLPKNS